MDRGLGVDIALSFGNFFSAGESAPANATLFVLRRMPGVFIILFGVFVLTAVDNESLCI